MLGWIHDLVSFLFAPLVAIFSIRDALCEWVQENWWQIWRSYYVFALWNVNDDMIINDLVSIVWMN